MPEAETSLAHGAARGAAWNFVTVLAERGIGFLILALLLRMVPAREVGLIAIATAISELARSVANSGAGEQVLANPGEARVEAGAFWSQLVSASLCLLILWGMAPWVASLYRLPALVVVLRFMALSVVMTCFLIVPSARLTSQFRFKSIGLISLGSTLLGGACALPLAFMGDGLEALVAQRLVGVGFYAVAVAVCAGWVPPRPPSWPVLREGFRFSRPLMEAAFVDFISVSGYVMLVGLRMPVTALAQFRIAQRLSDVLQEVAFLPARKLFMPVLVAVRADEQRRAAALHRMLEPLLMLVFFVSAVSGAASRPIILLMFGPEWQGAVPVFGILTLAVPALALYGVINPLLTASGQARSVSWYAWANAASIGVICWLAAPRGLVTLAWALAARAVVGVALFLLALRQGLASAFWPVFRLLGLPLAGLAGARLAAHGVGEMLGAASPAVELAVLVLTSALAYAAVMLVLAPFRMWRMARRLSSAFSEGRVLP
ncbi:oligosaccharide flippase family protein [Acidocella sp.]|uniref:oligosaccharide flippase family protein n=1 Tax=Acidocella sp. TaxID=50710 RepID=UPI003D0713AA